MLTECLVKSALQARGQLRPRPRQERQPWGFRVTGAHSGSGHGCDDSGGHGWLERPSEGQRTQGSPSKHTSRATWALPLAETISQSLNLGLAASFERASLRSARAFGARCLEPTVTFQRCDCRGDSDSAASSTLLGVDPAPRTWNLGTALNELSFKGCFLFGMCVISVVPGYVGLCFWA